MVETWFNRSRDALTVSHHTPMRAEHSTENELGEWDEGVHLIIDRLSTVKVELS